MNHLSLALSARMHAGLIAAAALHTLVEDSPKRQTAYNDGTGTHSLTSKGFGSGNKASAKHAVISKMRGKNGTGLPVANHREPRRAIGLKCSGRHLALDD